MTEEKKTKILCNIGKRAFGLKNGSTFSPGGTVEVSLEEATELLGYSDIKEFSKMSPEVSKTIEELKAENARLRDEIKSIKPVAKEKIDAPEVNAKEPVKVKSKK